MKRVVLFCSEIVDARMAGPGLRYWELAHALARRGLDVTLALPEATTRSSDEVALAVHGFQETATRRLLAAADVAVIHGFLLFHVPAVRAADRPLAVDLFTPLAIENLENDRSEPAAERGRIHRTNLAVQNQQLARGDFFLSASERQRDYWLGLLVALGRVTAAEHAADRTLRRLIDVVPFGLPAEPPVHRRPVLKGVQPGIGPDDVVLLWGGGVWGWFDPLTPIRALAGAGRAELKLFFMGRGHPNPRLTALAETPAYAAAVGEARALGLLDRQVFFNREWVPYDERGSYLLEADIGVSAHRDHVEAALAVRTRLYDYIWAGLPMIVSAGDSLSEELVGPAGLGAVVAPGDVAGWAAALDQMAREPDRRGARAAAFAQARAGLSWDQAVAPLAEFCLR